MRAAGVGKARWRLSGLVATLVLSIAGSTLLSAPAEARRKHHRAKATVQRVLPNNYAAYVVDANTGRTLFARNEDALRHPASVTKVMTLYLLFEQLEKGRFRLDSPLRVSAHSASMAPSKLGLRPGQTIEVEDAIKALVTKSANDVAATVAENIAGDEDAFAAMMTRKARSLGMSSTVYRNASGLPDPQQVTTARDLSILGRAIQERFPRQYQYFSTSSFRYGGRSIRNHNRLLGRVEGVDGIKTGYTRASGFNLLTSARRGGRHIVGVVLGGRTAGQRDMIMAQLVDTQIARASTSRSATRIASADDIEEAPVARRVVAEIEPARPVARAPLTLASATPMAAAAVAASQTLKARPAVVSDDDDGVTTASVRPPRTINAPSAVVAASSTPSALRLPSRAARRAQPERAEVQKVALVTPPRRESLGEIASRQDGKPDGKTARKAGKAEESEQKAHAKPVERDATRPSGWSIQIGATDDPEKAQALIAKARSAARLAAAKPYTEKVQKGAATLYRARFAGLETDEAQAACKQLKRSGFACFATRN